MPTNTTNQSSTPVNVAAGILEPVPPDVADTKQWRKDLDATLEKIKSKRSSRERALTITKIQEATHWLDEDLRVQGVKL